MSPSRLFKIAVFGIRKFPPSNGAAGADYFAYNLFTRLNKSFFITIFVKGNKFKKIKYSNNIEIISIPTIYVKGLSTFIHSFLVSIYIIFNRSFKFAHTQNGGNAIFCHLLSFFGINSFCSYDGIDKNRKAWGIFGKLYLSISEVIASKLKERLIIDNKPTTKYFNQKYKKRFTHIPFGSDSNISLSKKNPLASILRNAPYLVFVGRFVEDKGIDYLIKAFKASKISNFYKLVIVGGPSERVTDYSKKIESYSSESVKVVGFYYGKEVNKIISDAFYYIQPSFVEGLSPVILQSIGLKTNVLVSDIKENLEIVKDKDLAFKVGNIESLKNKLDSLIIDSLDEKQKKLQKRILSTYSWNRVAKEHEKLFLRFYNS